MQHMTMKIEGVWILHQFALLSEILSIMHGYQYSEGSVLHGIVFALYVAFMLNVFMLCYVLVASTN